MPSNGIDNGSTAKIALYCVLSSDHITAATGKTVVVTISKNGAAFGNPSAGATNATEIGSGWYYFTPSATDTGTNGPLLVRGTNAATDDATRDYMVATGTRIKTNTALSAFVFAMYDSVNINDLKTGLSPTVTLSIDGAAFAAATNSPAEIGSTGVYKIDLAAADLNGTVITLRATATGALTTLIELVTQP